MKHLIFAFALLVHCLACAAPRLKGVTDKDPLSYAVGEDIVFTVSLEGAESFPDGVLATCPTRALKLYGKPMSIDEIVAKALEDKAFYDESGGGVTLSGGEPLFFWEWAAELFKAFKAAGLHTCLDTSLYAPSAAIDALLPVTDLWLPDYKADDDALHVKFTGVSNKVIRENLKRLVAAKAKMEVRCLVVPNCTDGADLAARHAYLNSIGVPESSIVNLEYFDYARSKYLALGMPDTMPPKGA